MEKGPEISPEEFKDRRSIESEEAQRRLQKDLDESASLSEEEIEEKLLSIEGVKPGEDSGKLKEYLKKKRRK